MKIGYVTFVNNNSIYLELNNILVDSVLEFSDKSIEVFGVNFDYNYKPNESRIIRKRYNIFPENFQTICMAKTFSSLNSTFDYGLQCDADMIITPEADEIFKECFKIDDYPLGSLHPQDPNNQQEPMRYLGVKTKTQPYLHATYLFNKKCEKFFTEVLDLQIKVLNKEVNFTLGNHDETAYNAVLWKYKADKYLNTYDPYFTFFIDNYINKLNVPYPTPPNILKKINYYICHGCKTPNISRDIFQKIKNLNVKNNPVK